MIRLNKYDYGCYHPAGRSISPCIRTPDCSGFQACTACPPASAGHFSFTALDAVTLHALEGAVFILLGNGAIKARAISDLQGIVSFSDIPPGAYQLQEETPTPCYQVNTQVFSIVVNVNGTVTVNGDPAAGFTFYNIPIGNAGFAFSKLHGATFEPLPEAVFSLQSNSGILVARAISDSNGLISFMELAPGAYQLQEVIPPTGYQPNTQIFNVVIAADGAVTIDNMPASEFIAYDSPSTFQVMFRKQDGLTNASLPGATFELSQGSVIDISVSNAVGIVSFNNVPPGAYTLIEIEPPPGYINNPNISTVVVDTTGQVTIDGILASSFIVENTASS